LTELLAAAAGGTQSCISSNSSRPSSDRSATAAGTTSNSSAHGVSEGRIVGSHIKKVQFAANIAAVSRSLRSQLKIQLKHAICCYVLNHLELKKTNVSKSLFQTDL
jgi:hypothetical protein